MAVGVHSANAATLPLTVSIFACIFAWVGNIKKVVGAGCVTGLAIRRKGTNSSSRSCGGSLARGNNRAARLAADGAYRRG